MEVAPEATRGSEAPVLVRWLPPLAVLVAVAIAFAPALGAGFVSYDDPENLVRNPSFRGLSGEQLAWMLQTGWMGHYQPLTWVSLALDYVRGGGDPAGGLDPAPFHATNLVLHALTALAVLALARRLFVLAGLRDATRIAIGATCAALVFAVHPLRVESVAWVTERRDVLSAPFFVLSVLCWLRWGGAVPVSTLRPRRLAAAGVVAAAALVLLLASVDRSQPGTLAWGPAGAWGLALSVCAWALSIALTARAAPAAPRRWLFACAALLLLSLGSKAWGIVMPALLLVLDGWPLRRAQGSPARLRSWGLLALEKVPLAALCAALGTLASWAQASQAGTMRSLADHTLGERAAQGLYGLAFYPARTLVPLQLSPIYDLPRELSLAQPRFLVPALGVVALTAVVVALRRRAPALLTAWLAFAVIVSPVLGLTQSGPQLVADRYAYLAGLPFALLAGAALVRGLALQPRRAALWLGVACVAVGILAGLSRRQARIWRDSESLWTHALAVQPESPMAHLGLGYLRLERALAEPDPTLRRKALEPARALLERGAQLGDLPRLYSNLALVEGALGELEPEPQRAAEHLERALALSTRALDLARARGGIEPELQLAHAVHLVRSGRVHAALPWFEAFVRDRPADAQGHLRYGAALLAAERVVEARRELELALALEPGNEAARRLLDTARATPAR